jgi:hypothetical protein
VANGFPDKIQFDIKSAVEAGLNEEDIAKHVSNRRSYDYDAARKAGLTDSDIISYNVEGVRDIGRLRAFGEEAGLTAATTAPASLVGMKQGFKAGLKLPGGPWAKFIGALGGALIGGAAGAIAGEFGKEKIKEELDIDGQLTPSRRPFQVAGETFGFIGAAGAPFVARGIGAKANEAIARRAAGMTLGPAEVAAPNFGAEAFLAAAGDNPGMSAAVNRVMGRNLQRAEGFFGKAAEGAVRRPLTTLAAETTAGLSAAAGAGIAETVAPGEILPRLGAELALGIFNPVSFVGNRGSQLIKNGISRFKGGDERALNDIAKSLVKVIDDSPEDMRPDLNKLIDDILADLPEEDRIIFAQAREASAESFPSGKMYTVAEKTDNEFLRALQEVVMRRDPKAAAAILKRAREGSSAISGVIDNLMSSMDPSVLATASKMQNDQFTKALEGLLNQYTVRALDRASRVAATTDEEYAAAGNAIFDTVTTALSKAREIESTLYKNVDNKIELNATNVLKAYLDELNPAKGGFPEKALGFDKTVRQFIQRIAPEVSDAELDLISKLQLEIAEIESSALPILAQVDETGDRLQLAIGRALGNDGDTVKTLRNIQTQDDLVRLEDELRSMQTQARADDGQIDGLARESRPALTRQKNAALKLAKKSLALNTTQKRVMEAAEKTPEAVNVTSGDLIGFRSHVLKLARQNAADSNRASDAGFYSKLANAAGEDLGTRSLGRMTPEEIAAMDPAQLDAIKNLDAAYSFSKSLNDVFTRGFGGTLYAKNAKGGNRLIPELAGDKLRATTGLPTSLRMKELDDALDFVIREVPDAERAELESLKGTLRGAEEVVLRRLGRDRNIVNPTTGEVNVNGLNTFLRNQGELLQTQFPKLFEDLQDAGKAQVMLAGLRERQAAANEKLEAIGSFKSFLGKDESPSLEIDRLLGVPGQRPSPNAIKNLVGLIRFTEKARAPQKSADPNFVGPPVNKVKQGLKETIYDSAWRHSGGDTEAGVDFVKMRKYLMGPVSRGSQSVMNVLESRGVVSANEVKNWTALFNAAEKFQTTLNRVEQGTLDETAIQGASMMQRIVARFIGVKGGSALSRKMGMRGGDIQTPGIGGDVLENLANKLPHGRAWDILTRAMQEEDGKILVDLLKRANTIQEGQAIYGRLKGVLRSVGGRALTDSLEFSDYEGAPTAQMQPRGTDFDQPMRRPLARDPVTLEQRPRPQPTPQAQARPQPAPRPAAPAPQPASSSAESRARFAQMYPFDITSDIIRSGG